MLKLKRIHRVEVTVLLLAVCAAVVAVLVFSLGADATPPAPALKDVSLATLAQAGVHLQAPTSAAKVSSDAAAKISMQAFPGSTVGEAVLADFSDTNRVPAIHALAWVVSLRTPTGFHAPSYGPPPGDQTLNAPSYLVVVIDATTGAFIEGTAGS